MKTPGCDDGTDEVSHTQHFIREVKLTYHAVIALGVVIAVVDCAIFLVDRLHSRYVCSPLSYYPFLTSHSKLPAQYLSENLWNVTPS